MIKRSKTICLVAAMSLTTTVLSPVQAQNLNSIVNSVRDKLSRSGSDSREDTQHRGPSGTTIVGTAACAGLGAAAKRLIFGKHSKIPDIAGALMGGAFCFSLLSKKDNDALNRRGTELINQPGTSNTVWSAPDTGQQVTIETGPETIQQKNVDFQYNSEVAKPTDNTIVEAKTYVVLASRLNFRSSPNVSTNENIIGYFNHDANVEVIGYTPDRKWALVGDEGVVVGYAALADSASKLLATPEEAQEIRLAQAQQEAARLRGVKQRNAALAAARQREAARSLDRAKPLTVNGTPLAQTRVVTAQVSASTRCKAQVARTGDQALSRNGCELANGQFRFA